MLSPRLLNIAAWPTVIAGGAALLWGTTELVWAAINQWSRMFQAGREFVAWLGYRKSFNRWFKKFKARLDTDQRSLEGYLHVTFDQGIIDHHLRASIDSEGTVRFYIHPQNASGETLDFEVDGDDLIALKYKCKCGTGFLVSSRDKIPPHDCVA